MRPGALGVAALFCFTTRRSRARFALASRAIRGVLYLGAVAVMRLNPASRSSSYRLKQRGKKSKIVIVACMRKRISLLNAMLRDNHCWNQ